MILGFTLERPAAHMPSWLAHRATKRATGDLLPISSYPASRDDELVRLTAASLALYESGQHPAQPMSKAEGGTFNFLRSKPP